jgi:cell division protein FtsL
MSKSVEIDERLTLKSLQNHLIKTILGALVVTIIGAFFTSYSFYYNTVNNITELNESKTETANDIKELKKDVSEIKINLSETGIYTTANKEQIDNLNSDIKEIRKSQEEMMKILIEMNGKRK